MDGWGEWDQWGRAAGLTWVALRGLQEAGGSAGLEGQDGLTHPSGKPELFLPGSLPCGLLSRLVQDCHLLVQT